MSSLQVLVIDDEPAIRQVLTAALARAGYSVEQVANGNEALERLAKGDIDAAVCDINMPGLSGIELVRRSRAAGIDTCFIMMTAFASVDTALEAMKAGAFDYMIKPLRNDELLHRLAHIVDLRGLRDENKVLRSLVIGQRDDQFRFESPTMLEVERLTTKVAPIDSTVLVTGESGTGKGVVARTVHQLSKRASGPFIPVNCGAIPENLMESEFFGHTKGAFTGADKARKGLFLEADKGTLFLDEIGELPLQLQTKLLHVIESREVRPVGSEQMRRVDVRIVAATNRDLNDMVANGKFREDLYFRLSVFKIQVPPLRERRQDIPGLARFLLLRAQKRFGSEQPISIDPEVEDFLMAHDWPGNVRQLENVIDRALILAEGGRITVADLPPEVTRVAPTVASNIGMQLPRGGTLWDRLRALEVNIIQQAIADAKGDRKAASQELGIGLSTLYRKLEEFERLGLL